MSAKLPKYEWRADLSGEEYQLSVDGVVSGAVYYTNTGGLRFRVSAHAGDDDFYGDEGSCRAVALTRLINRLPHRIVEKYQLCDILADMSSPKEAAPPIPDGYELLAAGSVLREGDMLFTDGQWIKTAYDGWKSGGKLTDFIYIRPTAPVNHVVSLAPLLDPEPDYLEPVTRQMNWRVEISFKDKEESESLVYLPSPFYASKVGRVLWDTFEVCPSCSAPWIAGDSGDNRCCMANARAFAERVEKDNEFDPFTACATDVLNAWKRTALLAMERKGQI